MLAPTRPLLDIAVVCSAARWRVVVGGELDLRSGQDLDDVVERLVVGGAAEVDLDLGAVSFIDTAGWDAVGAAQRRVMAAGGVCHVATLGPAVTRFVRIVGGTHSGESQPREVD